MSVLCLFRRGRNAAWRPLLPLLPMTLYYFALAGILLGHQAGVAKANGVEDNMT